jgi:hypothetical protein
VSATHWWGEVGGNQCDECACARSAPSPTPPPSASSSGGASGSSRLADVQSARGGAAVGFRECVSRLDLDSRVLAVGLQPAPPLADRYLVPRQVRAVHTPLAVA